MMCRVYLNEPLVPIVLTTFQNARHVFLRNATSLPDRPVVRVVDKLARELTLLIDFPSPHNRLAGNRLIVRVLPVDLIYVPSRIGLGLRDHVG